ncbi:diaminopimelate decarboxylase [Streptomyces sp. TRM66268-LWL]|uniref:Diaminopimelate decarboxylase n=1 Tax=Streptomyces polyasparticus TaxID=2767826 RepID=A0ABR7SM37_9ACTN|nr:diaminopimelate decarboxylase [Streptomyces polyasparticus]MBC9716057.1 diaminopimelate decarboxylase [Streptomyces polyasparticus]
MPISPGFEARLHPVLAQAAEEFGTPFHIYDEQGVHDTCTAFNAAFAHLDFQEFYAVKALPNPTVLALLAGHGFGFDCSSLPELALAAQAGARGHQICFTSNNTSRAELAAALELGAIVNIDDEAVLDKLPSVPDTLFFRLNPGQVRGEDDFLGSPQDAKFGVPTDRLVPVVAKAKALGVRDFGLHMMLASNSLTPAPTLLTLDLLLEQALRLREELGVEVSAVNLGGGIGIPYRPDERPFDLPALGEAIARRLARWEHEHRATRPRVCFESGRYVTGPHGALATRVLNRMDKWRAYAGVDASMSSLMRPALYPSAYHHITAPFADRTHMETVDVVGSLCENNDRFGKDRTLPRLTEGELLVIHDTGAHGHAMGFTYNGRLRPQELLLRTDGSVELIRRAEEERDHFATLDFKPKRLVPRGTSGAGE